MAGMLHAREAKNACRNLVGKPTVGIPRRRHGKGKVHPRTGHESPEGGVEE